MPVEADGNIWSILRLVLLSVFSSSYKDLDAATSRCYCKHALKTPSAPTANLYTPYVCCRRTDVYILSKIAL